MTPGLWIALILGLAQLIAPRLLGGSMDKKMARVRSFRRKKKYAKRS